ncbi:MAG: oxygen-independent coproporphyrinogen III oxidase [Pseudomonadota bacterium]
MKPSWRKYLHQNVPRYTSYPSALQFSDAVGRGDFVTALHAIQMYQPISLYVHIPFCKQLCWYCGCNMRVENRYERAAQYVDVLLEEIKSVARCLAGRGLLTQVHFGGGTPNYLKAQDLGRIVDAIEDGFGLTDATPIAIELDPRMCGQNEMAKLVEAGISRISLGVQDFTPAVQEAINRVQPYGMIEECVSAAREVGIDDISFDLLLGLPKQTPDNFGETIRQTIALGPERISLFGYAHMPSRLPHQRLIVEEDMPGRDSRAALFEEADKSFIDNGYMPIGFDHYARPHSAIALASMQGRLNRNFQGYTEDPSDTIIGVGASAISSTPYLHVQNEKSVGAYMDAVGQTGMASARGARACEWEGELGGWLKRLLCDRRANLSRYREIMPPNAEQFGAIQSALELMQQDGILTLDGDDLWVMEEAKPLLRTVAAVFDPMTKAGVRFAAPAI